MSPEEEKPRGLTRERLVEAALALIHDDGLDGLSMRALADRLDVKAASLYWHVRDRRELLELLAESILDGVRRPRQRASWRETVIAIAAALRAQVSAQNDADRVLLEVVDAVERSDTFGDLRTQLIGAGLQLTEAGDVALMVMAYVISGRMAAEEPAAVEASGEPASVAIDSGSRGVILRAGDADMQTLIRVPHDQAAAAPAVVHGEQVVVRRLRGVGRGEIELNPRRPWRFKIQAPTWNTVLDVGGLDVREIWIDSGAANVECFLPLPRGVVPIHVSSGVVNISMHRPPTAAVVALAHTGAVRLKLDQFSTKVAVFDVHWQSGDSAIGARDRYELEVSGGVVDFKLDTYTPKVQRVDATPAAPQVKGEPASALEILLDGVEARVKSR
ncbi:MAG TPA: TetR family transcriptional regulator [Candidatus Limnocylindrales bacterium]|nr:TetR family transcriptional regulator [Candidatus Limnocylindrales bacterium]